MRVQGKQPEKKLGFIDANVQVHVGNGLRIAVLVEDNSQSASGMAGNWKRPSPWHSMAGGREKNMLTT